MGLYVPSGTAWTGTWRRRRLRRSSNQRLAPMAPKGKRYMAGNTALDREATLWRLILPDRTSNIAPVAATMRQV